MLEQERFKHSGSNVPKRPSKKVARDKKQTRLDKVRLQLVLTKNMVEQLKLNACLKSVSVSEYVEALLNTIIHF